MSKFVKISSASQCGSKTTTSHCFRESHYRFLLKQLTTTNRKESIEIKLEDYVTGFEEN